MCGHPIGLVMGSALQNPTDAYQGMERVLTCFGPLRVPDSNLTYFVEHHQAALVSEWREPYVAGHPVYFKCGDYLDLQRGEDKVVLPIGTDVQLVRSSDGYWESTLTTHQVCSGSGSDRVISATVHAGRLDFIKESFQLQSGIDAGSLAFARESGGKPGPELAAALRALPDAEEIRLWIRLVPRESQLSR